MNPPIYDRLATVVRSLTVVAGLVILLGGFLLILRDGGARTSFHKFEGEPAALRFAPEIAARAFEGNALAIVQLGILLLIANPVLRVLFAGIGFALERDWTYVAIAAIVLSVLASSLMVHSL